MSRSPHPSRPRTRAAALLSLCLLAGCQGSPPIEPLELPPGLVLDTFHHAGSLLTGAVPLADPEALETDPTLALSAAVEVFYVERLPALELDPLTAHTRLVAALHGDQPILPVSEALRNARLGIGEEALRLRERLEEGEFGRFRMVPRLEGALPDRATCLFTARRLLSPEEIQAAPKDSEQAGYEGDRISMEVTRGEPALGRKISLALSVHRDDAPDSALPPVEGVERQRALFFSLEEQVAELVLLDLDLEVGGPPVVLITANPRIGDQGTGFVSFLSITEAPDPDTNPAGAAAHRNALDRCIADCKVADELAEDRAKWLSAGELRLVGFSAVLDLIQPGEVDRGFLVGLATAVRANLVADVAMLADPEQLDHFANVLLLERKKQANPETEDGIAWLIDRAAWRLIAEAAMRTELPPEHQSIILRHAGAVGRYPGTILEALSSCKGLAEFHQRIVEENWMLLRDTRPGTRVRAFDWLVSKGQAPAGYEPMGPVDERRDAMEAFARRLEGTEAAPPSTTIGGQQ